MEDDNFTCFLKISRILVEVLGCNSVRRGEWRSVGYVVASEISAWSSSGVASQSYNLPQAHPQNLNSLLTVGHFGSPAQLHIS